MYDLVSKMVFPIEQSFQMPGFTVSVLIGYYYILTVPNIDTKQINKLSDLMTAHPFLSSILRQVNLQNDLILQIGQLTAINLPLILHQGFIYVLFPLYTMYPYYSVPLFAHEYGLHHPHFPIRPWQYVFTSTAKLCPFRTKMMI